MLRSARVALALDLEGFDLLEVGLEAGRRPRPLRRVRGGLPEGWVERLPSPAGRSDLAGRIERARREGKIRRGPLALVLPDALASYEARALPAMEPLAIRELLARSLPAGAGRGFSAAPCRSRDGATRLFVLRYAVDRTVLESLALVLRQAGFDPRVALPAAVARTEFHRSRVDSVPLEPSLALLEVGDEETILGFFQGRSLAFLRVLDRGRNHPDVADYLAEEGRRALLFCLRSLGAEISVLRVAGLREGETELADRLATALEVEVEVLDADELPEPSPGVLAGLSAAPRLAAFEGDFNLLPPTMAGVRAGRWRGRLAAALALAFAVATVPAHLRLREDVRAARERLAGGERRLAEARTRLSDERPAIARACAIEADRGVLAALGGERRPCGRLLGELGSALPDRAGLSRVAFALEERGETTVTLAGEILLAHPREYFEALAEILVALESIELLREPCAREAPRSLLLDDAAAADLRVPFEFRARLAREGDP